MSLLLCNAATAAAWNFSQGGYAEGATISGSFSGTDLDGDGQLSFFGGEVTEFAVGFSGNSLVPAFTLGFADLFALVADLDGTGVLGDGTTGDIEGIGADDGSFSFLAGPGPVDLCGGPDACAFVQMFGGGSDSSFAAVNFSVVPLPAAAPLLLCALLALAGAGPRRRH